MLSIATTRPVNRPSAQDMGSYRPSAPDMGDYRPGKPDMSSAPSAPDMGIGSLGYAPPAWFVLNMGVRSQPFPCFLFARQVLEGKKGQGRQGRPLGGSFDPPGTPTLLGCLYQNPLRGRDGKPIFPLVPGNSV